ncbi:NUDIX domain-containing protein [Candidatus Woesebacteria bacterium]|nr:NUDIX domain-containing protein [Candidatus Woesebacteria bacterium]
MIKVDKLFVATKAFVYYKGKILLLQESGNYGEGSNEGKFDVPGGRIEPGQRFDKSLLREIREETGLSVTLGRPFFVDEWRPKVKGQQWQIVGTFFEVFAKNNKVILSKDHSNYIWIDPKDYTQYQSLLNSVKNAFGQYIKIKYL